MTDYPFDMQLVVDPLNPENVVRDGKVYLYDPSDTAGVSPIPIRDPSGLPLGNPLTSNAYGFLQPTIVTIPRVKWKSGTFEGFFYSYDGLRNEAIAARAAAEAAQGSAATAGANAAAAASTALAGAVADAESAKAAAQSAAALVNAPADAAIAAAVNGAGTATKAALNATYAPASGSANYAVPDDTGLGYLIGTFAGNGAGYEKLYLHYSVDGKAVTSSLRGPVYTPAGVTIAGLRDPSMMKIGATWYVAHTINDGQGKLFEVASSKDLLSWSKVASVDVSSVPNLVKAWAPELIQDTNGDVYALFSRMDANTIGKTYYVKATNAALTAWTTPTALSWTAQPANCIDPTFIRHNGQWFCFFKNETTKSIERASATTLTGTYTIDKTGDWAGWGGDCEGPELVRIGSKWRIYIDRYFGDGYAYSESTDLNTWTPLTTIAKTGFYGGQTIRHGSFIRLTSPVDMQAAIAATTPPTYRHAELTFQGSQAAGSSAAATPAVDPAKTPDSSFLTTEPNAIVRVSQDGIYQVDFVATFPAGAGGNSTTGSFMAIKGPGETPIYASADLPPISGAWSVSATNVYLTAGEMLQFWVVSRITQTVSGRIRLTKMA